MMAESEKEGLILSVEKQDHTFARVAKHNMGVSLSDNDCKYIELYSREVANKTGYSSKLTNI